MKHDTFEGEPLCGRMQTTKSKINYLSPRFIHASPPYQFDTQGAR